MENRLENRLENNARSPHGSVQKRSLYHNVKCDDKAAFDAARMSIASSARNILMPKKS